MKRGIPWAAAMIIGWLAIIGGGHPVLASDNDPVVRTVLFYSPTCPHCHQVMTEDLPPIMEHYGERLQILSIDTTQPGGQTLYQAAIEHYAVPEERWGVPALFIGDTLLVGSYEIPELLPDLIDQHLANGGVDWPDIPGLVEAISEIDQESASSASPDQTTVPSLSDNKTEQQSSIIDRFNRDLAGNSLAVLVLLGMVASLLFAIIRLAHIRANGLVLEGVAGWRDYAITALCISGLGIALYLTYVETTKTLAVCGPVGDCNTVQQSAYARLFGVIPIGALGAAGYVMILTTGWLRRLTSGDFMQWMTLSVFSMALVGTLFSIYLTFLEPFVIGATCAWCLTSAIVMTSIMLLVTDSGASALTELNILSPRRRRRATASKL